MITFMCNTLQEIQNVFKKLSYLTHWFFSLACDQKFIFALEENKIDILIIITLSRLLLKDSPLKYDLLKNKRQVFLLFKNMLSMCKSKQSDGSIICDKIFQFHKTWTDFEKWSPSWGV